jgi:hypothetical protein
MASISSPAATAAGESSVTVEDESPILKRCCGCCSDRPESDFSGAQLKRKGKRMCKACVEKREWVEAKAADDAAAAKAAARPTPAGASSSAAAAAASPPTATVCIVCGQGGAKMRACSRCRSFYCGAVCLKLHSGGDMDQCAAVRSLPPLSIAEEDLLTEPEIRTHLMHMTERLASLLPPPLRATQRSEIEKMQRVHVPDLSQLYPPRIAAAWWTPGGVRAKWTAQVIENFGAHMYVLAEAANRLYQAVTVDPTVHITDLDRLIEGPSCPHVPPALDSSRLFHRLLRYLIYYFRNVDSSLIDPRLRPYVDVQSDDDGEFIGARRQR